MEEGVLIVGMVCSICSIVISYLALKRNNRIENRTRALNEGIIINDITHIKQSIDRMEQKLDKEEQIHQELKERVLKLEEQLEAHMKGEKIWKN